MLQQGCGESIIAVFVRLNYQNTHMLQQGCGESIIAVWTWCNGNLELQDDVGSFLKNGKN